MPTMQEKLETLFAKVRELPQLRQEAAIETLTEIAGDPYLLCPKMGSLCLKPPLSAPSVVNSPLTRQSRICSQKHGAESPA